MTVPCNCFAPGSDLWVWLRSKSRRRSAKDSVGSSGNDSGAAAGWDSAIAVAAGSTTGSGTGYEIGFGIGSGTGLDAASSVGRDSVMFSSVMTGQGPFSHAWAKDCWGVNQGWWFSNLTPEEDRASLAKKERFKAD